MGIPNFIVKGLVLYLTMHAALVACDVLICIGMSTVTLRMALSQKAWAGQMQGDVFETPSVVKFNQNSEFTFSF